MLCSLQSHNIGSSPRLRRDLGTDNESQKHGVLWARFRNDRLGSDLAISPRGDGPAANDLSLPL